MSWDVRRRLQSKAPFSAARRDANKLLASIALLPLWPAGKAASRERPDYDPFAIYYGYYADDAVRRYRLAVLDSDVEKAAIEQAGERLLLGYLSIGEVASSRAYYPELAEAGLLGATNPNWPDANYIDMRDERWCRMVVDKLVPAILSGGFAGIFVDTLDNAEFLEVSGPEKCAGMMNGAARIIREIHAAHPDAPIMINRGYGTIPQLAGSFSMLLGESVISRFDGKGGYEYLPDSDYHWQKTKMLEARSRDPDLLLFSLDYWNPEDRAAIEEIYRKERANGFIPYVATPELNVIVAEP